MKVLIAGAGGQVGRALMASAPRRAEVTAVRRAELDIRDAAAVRALCERLRPDVIVNAAAYTAVDKAESEPALAAAINAGAPAYLAAAARDIQGCRLIHISTDYVFDGLSNRPYKPKDVTNPVSVYGRTKLDGERAVLLTLDTRAVVLRTAWVYAAEGKNFLLTMLRLMGERGAVCVVADQIGTPTAAPSVARAIWRIVELPDTHGVLHWTDDGVASWYDFAAAIAKEALAAGLLVRAPRVTPIMTAEYPTAAHRPANSVLDMQASISMLGIVPVRWQESLRCVLSELKPHEEPLHC